MIKQAVVVLNGIYDQKISKYLDLVEWEDSLIVAVDGGALLLKKIEKKPDIIIGDLDSLSAAKLNFFAEKGVEIKRYPSDKDQTDGELAIEYCSSQQIKKISIICALGGRYDQQFQNVFLLEYAIRLNLQAEIKEPGLRIGLVDNKKIIKNKKGARLSLIPLSFKVSGIKLNGCQYNLGGEDLFRYKSRGLSNIIREDQITICTSDGLLLYFIDDFNKD